MQIRFISDLHFNHENMAIHRGFSSAQEMNDYIIKQWNSVVTNKKDITYILGDITMERTEGYKLLDQLQGVKHVVLGNHDQRQHVPELLKHVNTVSGMINWKKAILLTHCAVHPRELEFRYKLNVHGHLHEHFVEDDPRYINVSAEVIGYRPKSLLELGIDLEKLKS